MTAGATMKWGKALRMKRERRRIVGTVAVVGSAVAVMFGSLCAHSALVLSTRLLHPIFAGGTDARLNLDFEKWPGFPPGHQFQRVSERQRLALADPEARLGGGEVHGI